ncbi:PAS domain-containing protein [Oxalobacteraceae bacterium]|nr:PAS domain-containing protein [Oxalobacteraceae bacterium]
MVHDILNPSGAGTALFLALALLACVSLYRLRRLRLARQQDFQRLQESESRYRLMLENSLRSEAALAEIHTSLERRIALRTAELSEAVEQLRREVAVRQAAEHALAGSEEKLHEIITMMPLALCIKDADSRIVLMNEACEAMWGISFSKMSGNRGSAFFPPDQMEVFLAHDRAAFAGRALIVNEEKIWNAQLQENRQFQTFKKPVFDAEGEPQMLLVMCVDITERKQAEDALERSLRQLRALSDHQEIIKEEERRRIALDIHDELGQNLLALKLDVSMLHERTGARHPRLHGATGKVLATLDTSIRSVRNIINELHPSTLELGLGAAIEWLLGQLERRSGLRCELQLIKDDVSALLDQRQTSGIFRIVQAALVNICAHAGASRVQLSLNLRQDAMTIVIVDNGPGASSSTHAEQVETAAFAIKGIRERVAAFGGELEIASSQGPGTTLSILLPGLHCAELAS